jgi:hypothetical protein
MQAATALLITYLVLAKPARCMQVGHYLATCKTTSKFSIADMQQRCNNVRVAACTALSERGLESKN